MDLLLNIDIIVDLCTGREPHARDSELALEKCAAGGGRLWLYTGSVASMQRAVYEQIRCGPGANPEQQDDELRRLAQDRLRKFCEGKQWLAALAEEGPVFEAPNPLSRQLILALQRFNAGSIRLLTRDTALLQTHSDVAITPQQYLTETTHAKQLAFTDLAAQQDRLRGV